MRHDLTPLSEIQKLFIFSPIKTYRLFRKAKTLGKLTEPDDWQMQDQTLYVSLPQFTGALEELGYQNFVRVETNSDQMISSDDILTTDEIIEDVETTPDEAETIPDEIERNDLNSDDDTLKSSDTTEGRDEVLSVKEEMIGLLKDSVMRQEREAETLREINKSLADQNRMLTFRLMAPKESGKTDPSKVEFEEVEEDVEGESFVMSDVDDKQNTEQTQ